MSKYPINYNFGKNWNTKIIPFLDHPRIKKAIKNGVNGYLNNWEHNTERYRTNTVPASYTSTDAYVMLMDRKEELKIEELRKENKLSKKFLKLEKLAQVEQDDDNDDDWIKFQEFKENVLNRYFSWKHVKYSIESYYLIGACHWFNPTFCLVLAELVEPNEKWVVREGVKHTTVINREGTKIFDLVYWGIDGRMENYLFGDKIEKRDRTLGGKSAFKNSAS